MPILGCLCSSISIRAPRMGSDDAAKQSPRSVPHFNPHSPHGERPRARSLSREYVLFQSTLPAWGATYRLNVIPRKQMYFNPRPPAWGATITRVSDSSSFSYFNPRPPHGERRNRKMEGITPVIFQSTLPHGERRTACVPGSPLAVFQSTLPHGERPRLFAGDGIARIISIHAPAWGAPRTIGRS